MNEVILNINKISKIYSDRVGYKIHLLQNIIFEINKTEITTILAPKGSGKTSLLKIIAGLENATSGSVNNIKPKVTFIPTKPSSYPWLNVEDNVKFAQSVSESDIKKIIKLVGLEGYEDHYPHNKSEGFRFRISLARALAFNPDVIAIDEPFNNLDSITREEIYTMLRNVNNIKGTTILFGTTNITEAIFLSDKIVIMKKKPGEIIDELKIDFGTERNISIIGSEKFISYRNKIEEIFKNKLDKPLHKFSV